MSNVSFKVAVHFFQKIAAHIPRLIAEMESRTIFFTWLCLEERNNEVFQRERERVGFVWKKEIIKFSTERERERRIWTAGDDDWIERDLGTRKRSRPLFLSVCFAMNCSFRVIDVIILL